MNEVILHGELGERYGAIPPLFVRDAAEALRALSSQLDGFRQAIRGGKWYVVIEGDDGKFAMDPLAMDIGLHSKKIHIVPEVVGAAGGQKGKGGLKIVLGVALIGASLIVPGMQGFGLAAAKAAWAAKIGVAGITFGHMALAGVALAMAGSALMIAPQPAMPSADAKADTNSFIFNGNQSPSGQGMAVPCVWGIFRAVPLPVATRIETDQIYIGGNYGGGVGGGGGYQNWPTGYDPSSGLTPEQYIGVKFTQPWLLD